MKGPKKSVYLTDNEIVHLLAMLRIAGFKEKRDYPQSFSGRRNDESRIIGRVMKRLRKAYESDK